MSSSSEASLEVAPASVIALAPAPSRTVRQSPKRKASVHERNLAAGIVTTSLTLHLLIVGVAGFGIRQDAPRVRRTPPAPTTSVIEDVKLEPAPAIDLPVAQTLDDRNEPARADLPANAELPAIPNLPPITAVAESVPVAFALPVKGPVRVVKDASLASGSTSLAAHQTTPISLDANTSEVHNLLLPPLSYPSEAARQRLSGEVEIEFRTTPTGEIYDVKIRRSSGSPVLDRAAAQNLRSGRWVGAAGYFLKSYSFVLPS